MFQVVQVEHRQLGSLGCAYLSMVLKVTSLRHRRRMLGKRSRIVMSTSVGDELLSSAEQVVIEVHEQLKDPEDSNLENEVCRTHSYFFLTFLLLFHAPSLPPSLWAFSRRAQLHVRGSC